MTTRAAPRALAVASVLAAACSDPTEPPLPAFAISPATQWSGGTIAVRSHYFVNRTPLPVVTAGTETLAVTRQDDSTLTASLPRGPSGPVTFSLARGTRRDSLASVQRVGFRERRTLAVSLDGELAMLPSAGGPLVLGGVVTGTEVRAPLSRVALRSGATVTFSGLRTPEITFYGLAPSSPSGAFAVRDSTDSLRLYDFTGGSPVFLATVPGVGTGFSRQAARLSSTIWLYTGSHVVRTWLATDSSTRFQGAVESPYGVFLSPRGDRTTLASFATYGMPVFDNATGDTAFTLSIDETEGAAFSLDGTELYAVGGQYNASDTLVAVDATSGAQLARVSLPHGFLGFSVAYSSTAGGRVLVGAANPTTMAVLVYDARTLVLRGVLPVPDNCGAYPTAGPCFFDVVAADDAVGVAYLVQPGQPSFIWTLDLLSP